MPCPELSGAAMRRRDFIKAVVGSAAVWPLAARAQQAGKVWRIGFIAHGHESFYGALFEGLREYRYEEGRSLIVERRYAQGQAERFKEFAAEIVRLNVDIIIVVTTPAALAVMNATKTIPIVHPNAIDPLNTGLIASLAHPGGQSYGKRAVDRRSQRKTPDVLRGEPSLYASSRRILRAQDFQRRKARRSACGTSYEVRPGHQPQHREENRVDDPGFDPWPRRRRDRIKVAMSANDPKR